MVEDAPTKTTLTVTVDGEPTLPSESSAATA